MMCSQAKCERPGRRFGYALGRRETILCDQCADQLIAMGMMLRPIEEAPRKPEWLSHLRGRDETGRLVA